MQLSELFKQPTYRKYFSESSDPFVYLTTIPANRTLLSQGDETSSLYYLARGRCRVFAVTAAGKQILVNTLQAPCLIGEIELISGDHPFRVETLEECELAVLPYSPCRELLLEDPRFLRQVAWELADKERKNALRMLQMASAPLVHRLAVLLLENAQQGRVRLKKTLIAQSLGVSYRHLEKVMKDLCEAGILVQNGKDYTIQKAEKLQELADAVRIF